MILQTLTIENFRKFKQASLEFPEGIIGVVGLNGVGKSTIFEAVAWALYGSAAARTSSEEIKRNSAEPSSPCRVVVTFLFEGKAFRVVREMTGKSMIVSATVTMNDAIAATGAGPVTKFIQKTLGMDYKSFFTSIFARQNELNTLSSMNASERRPLILRMLGIDTLDDVIRLINADKRTKTSIVAHLEKNLLDASGNKKEDIFHKKTEELRIKKKSSQQEMKALKIKVKEIKEQRNTLKKDAQLTQKNYELVNKEYERIIEQKTRYEKKQKIEEELSFIVNKIKKRDEELQQLSKQKNQLKDGSADSKECELRLEHIQGKITHLLKKNEQQKSTINHLSSHMKDIHLKQTSVEKIGPDAPCPTCERELGDQFHFLIKNYGDEQHQLQKKISVLEKELEKISNEKEKYHRERDALKKKLVFLRKHQTEHQKIHATMHSIAKVKKEEEGELVKKQQLLSSFKKVTFDSGSFKETQEKRKLLYKEYKNKVKQLNEKKEEHNHIVLDLEKKQSNLALIAQQVKNIEKQKNELKQMKLQIEKEQELVSKLNMLRDVMMSFRLHLVSRIRPALSFYASSFFHDLTDGKYPEITLDENYNIYIYDEGEKYTIQRFSGGEIDLANLCLRLAISDVITERAEGLFHFIILDEIFGSQDAFRQQNIMEQLYKLSAKYKQIFLITHVEQVKHFMQHIMHIQEIDGLSSVQLN